MLFVVVTENHNIFLVEDNFIISKAGDVTVFELNSVRYNSFMDRKGIIINSELLYSLNFTQRDIYIQPANDDNSLLYPCGSLDMNYENVKKHLSPYTEILFDGNDIRETIEYLNDFSKRKFDTKYQRFMISIVLSDGDESSTSALILIPILLS